MINMSIGTEPIAVTSLYPAAAPAAADVSDSSFAQSLQDTIDLGSAQTANPETSILTGESQQPDVVTVQESVQPMEDALPQQETLESEPLEEVFVVELVTNRDDSVQHFDGIQILGLSPKDFEKTEEVDETDQAPLQPDSELIDPELLKKLTDLLANTEEMLAAPQKMQDILKDLIKSAFVRLSDPEIKEEEFTEKVLEFLLKFIDKAYGGKEDSSSLTDSDDEDDTDVMDVLLQAVVQMLDNIRSENADDGVPEDTAEEVEGIEQIPDSNMAKEYVSTSVNQLLGEDENQAIQLNAMEETAPAAETDAAQQNGGYIPQPEQTERLQAETVSANEAVPVIPESAAAQTPTEKITVDNTAATEVKAEDTPKDMPAAETVQPAENAEDSALDQAAYQTAEIIFTAFVSAAQAQSPAASEDPAPENTGFNRKVTGTKPLPEPKDELAELTRMMKVNERIQAPELKTDPRRAVISPVKPVLEPESAGITVPFEAAIAKSVPQINLSHVFADSESGAEQIVTQIVSEIFNQLPETGGTTTFVMTLNPESLGKVTVKLVEEAGKISVSVTAHEKRTAEILSQRFDSLQTAMKENGTQLEKYQVVYAPEKDERSGQQNFDGSSKNPYVKQDDEEGNGDGEFAELLQNAV